MVWEYFGFAKGFISVWRTMYMCKKKIRWKCCEKKIRVQLNQSFRCVLLFHSSLMVDDWVKLYFMRFPLCKRCGLIFHPISFSFSLLLPLLLSHSQSVFLAFSPFGVLSTFSIQFRSNRYEPECALRMQCTQYMYGTKHTVWPFPW